MDTSKTATAAFEPIVFSISGIVKDLATQQGIAGAMVTAKVATSGSVAGTAYMTSAGLAVQLNQGWNFISPLVQPADSTISIVLSPVMSNIAIVWAWNSLSQQWLKFIPEGRQNTLFTMGQARVSTGSSEEVKENYGGALHPPFFFRG